MTKLCTKCDEPNETEFKTCEACRKKVKDHIDKLRDSGRCIQCGKINTTEFSRCDICRKTAHERWKLWKQKDGNAEILKERNRRGRQKRKDDHRCAQCGKPLESDKWVHCTTCREKMNTRANEWYHDRKLLVFQHYSKSDKPYCACCGESEIDFLCLDHINGGGSKHRRELNGNGRIIYQWVVKNNFPDYFRVLCANCNQAYGYYGKCPHQKQ